MFAGGGSELTDHPPGHPSNREGARDAMFKKQLPVWPGPLSSCHACSLESHRLRAPRGGSRHVNGVLRHVLEAPFASTSGTSHHAPAGSSLSNLASPTRTALAASLRDTLAPS